MGNPPNTISYDDFRQWVRQATRDLYDSPSLGHGLLAELFAVEHDGDVDHAQYIRRVILETIDAIQPNAGTPAQSPDWRGYRILELRYVEGLDPEQVMEHLGLQKSQYYADQARSLQALTDRLWERYRAAERRARDAEGGSATPSHRMVQAETERLAARAAWDEIDAAQLVNQLGTLVLPLARERRITLRTVANEPVRVGHTSRILLRQAILSVVMYSLDIAHDGCVEIATYREAREAGIRIRADAVHGTSQTDVAPPDREGRLALCRQWMVTLGGALRIDDTSGAGWCARLVWPALRPKVLLIIDDNRGFLELFRRYLAEHDWQVVGATSGAQARNMIATARPTAIILDVLMPQEDGWEVLVALRSSAETRDTPVIVCSVLNEPRLALSLGASAYLAKPVTEESLLRTLAPWCEPTASPAPRC